MGLNPGDSMRQKVLNDNFNSGSPYFGMYWAGYYGVPIEECIAKCNRNGIPLRAKDMRSYQDGVFQNRMGPIIRETGMSMRDVQIGVKFEDTKLEDYPRLPVGWHGTERRFFPCTAENKPMKKWGWSREYTPELFTKADAKALSPCGWVGQNLLYQRFVVMDIDGRGHGCDDEQVIEFGNLFKNETFTMEDPAKPGSFHLYFEVDRLLPTRHFPWAKLDFAGNAVNQAVYLKNKKPNGLPLLKMTEEVWQMMLAYEQARKEGYYVS